MMLLRIKTDKHRERREKSYYFCKECGWFHLTSQTYQERRKGISEV